MNHFFRALLIATGFALLTSSCTSASAKGPSPEARQLIESLKLQEASTASADIPGWNPKRIVVMTISPLGLGSPEFEQQLRDAAGDVELVIEKNRGYFPSAQAMAGADALIGLCTSTALEAADENLRWVHHYFVGMENCSGFASGHLEDVVFTNNKRLSGPAIAEHAIAMLMSLSRNLPAYHTAQSQKKWQQFSHKGVSFGELEGKTILVVGLGGIGTQIAQRAHGLGMRVTATRNSSRNGPEFVEYVGLADELHALAAKADVIVNALPLTAATTGLFDAKFFADAKKGSIFISVGRGKSTVTDDLVGALKSGHLFAAGLDVTDPEPLPEGSPLWEMSNVIITPHVSAAGADSSRRTRIISVENLRRYVAGEPLLNVVNVKRGY